MVDKTQAEGKLAQKTQRVSIAGVTHEVSAALGGAFHF